MLDEPRLVRMRDTMTHRGPDEAGVFLAPGVGLGHRRLSIVDVESGHQPMATEDGRFTLVYNGEIYNHEALKRGLAADGVAFRTRSDTETLLRLFAARGIDAVHALRGMFAFGVWDAEERSLMLVRDRLGIKPLYYVHRADGSLFFASEIKALVEAGAVEPALELDVLPDYLANHAPSGDRTLFRDVRRLPPGHYLVWKEGEIRTRRYWELSYEKPVEPVDEARLVKRFEELFREAVELRLMADVPLGAFLSGGIDSTTITAVMSQLVDEPIRTFSVAFAAREANELEFARMAAEAYGTRHREILLSPAEFFDALPRMVWHEDEPIAHPSSIALHFVARLASEDVKVVLTGEGSDELLGGYGRYWKTLVNLRLGRAWERVTPGPIRSAVRDLVGLLPRGSFPGSKLSRSFLGRPGDLESLYFDNFAVFGIDRQASLLSKETLERLNGRNPYEELQARFESADGDDLLDRLLAVDMGVYLRELLMKQDQMSMAASIESRVPFLDHRLVEFSASLPVSMKLRGRTTKHILREAFGPLLPDPILHRSKAGFPVPIGRWFRGEYRAFAREYLLNGRALNRGLFDPKAVERLVADHEAGRADHGQRIWSLVNLEIWQRLFIDGEPAPSVPDSQSVAGAR